MAPDAPTKTARRPTGWIVTSVILFALLLGATTYGVLAYHWTNEWRDEAATWEESATEWQGEAEQLETELGEREQEVEALEEEVGTLEDQVAQRDAEIVELEDRVAEVTAGREQARDQVAALTDRSELLEAVGSGLTACVDQLFAWIGSAPPYFASEAEVDRYFDAGYEIAEMCGTAQGDFAALREGL